MYRKNAAGAWSLEAYLKPNVIDAGDGFGTSVAIDGDLLVVGAIGEQSNAVGVNGNATDDSLTMAGAAYIFRRTGTTWVQEAYLKASNTNSNDQFGFEVEISGDTVAVSAPLEASNATTINGNQGDNSAAGAGAVYVFRWTGSAWSQQAYMKASNADGNDRFGEAISLSGNTLAVGALYEGSCATGVGGLQSDNNCYTAGAAYVFVRNAGTWSQEAYVKASNTETIDYFGDSVAVVGDVLVVGATGEDSGNQTEGDNSVSRSGAAYVFRRVSGSWSQQGYLKQPTPGVNNFFGTSVSASSDLVAVGASGQAFGGGVHVYGWSGTDWTWRHGLMASNAESGDELGITVALLPDGVVVGTPQEDAVSTGINPADSTNGPNGSTTDAGAFYIFN